MPASPLEPLPGVRRVGKLYLELLFRCNFRCTTCYHGEDLDLPHMLTAEQVSRALAYFADRYSCQRVCFLGGEPLLYKELPTVLAVARGLGYRTEICTNGYKRREVLRSCRPHLDLLRISFDGGTAESHDAIRRPGSFAMMFDTMAWAANQGLAFGATCTLTGQNISTVPLLAQRLHEAGAAELTLHRVRLIGNAITSNISEVTWEQARRLHAQLTTMDLGSMHINTDILLPERCPAPSDIVEKLEIAPDGRVYLSCAEVAGPGRTVRFDFDQGEFVGDDASVRSPASSAAGR